MLDQTTKRKIDTARDILVGKVPDPKQQVDQITNALIYKFMDDMDKESQELGGESKFFTDEFEKYSWTKLLDKRLSGQERLDLFSQAIANMPRNPHIPQLFRDVFKGAFLPYRDPETLSLFLKEIDGFTYDHSEDLGDAFEYLLSVLGSQGDAGQFRTPRHIIDFIVEVVDPKKNETILDPACGTAGFLISAYKHILRQHDGKDNQTGQLTTDESRLTPDDRKKMMNNFVGYDISPDMVKLSLVNLYLHGFPEPKIYEYDTLTSEKYWDDQFDVIMANPPFMTPKGGIRPHNRFTVSANRSEVLFVSYIMDHLNLKGRAGIIVPEGIIFQSANAYKELRENLIKDGLFAVVSLPPGVFNPYSGVKTSILFFDNTLAKSSSKILFLGIGNDGFSLGAQRSPIKGNQIPEVQKIIEKFKENPNINQVDLQTYARTIDTERILSNGADWVIEPLVVEKSKINNSGDFNLTWSRYKETEIHKNQQWPIVELVDVAEISSGNSAPQDEKLFENGKYPFFRTSDVGLVHLSDNLVNPRDYLNDNGVKGLKLFPKNTILFPKSGASIFLNHRAMLGSDGYVSSHLATIIPDKKKILPKFLFYLLVKIDAKKLTNGQNYPSLKTSEISNIKVPLPPLEIQKQIVEQIDGYQKIIDGAKQIISSWKPEIDIDPEWEKVKLGVVCEKLFAGGDVPKDNYSLEKNEKHQIPIYTNGINEKSLYGFTNVSKVERESLTISARGTIGYSEVRKAPFYPAVRLIVAVPDLEKIDIHFLKYSLDALDIYRNGNSIPQLTIPMITDEEISLPPLAIQKQIVEKIEEERKIVEGNKRLIEIYEKKIEEVISNI